MIAGDIVYLKSNFPIPYLRNCRVKIIKFHKSHTAAPSRFTVEFQEPKQGHSLGETIIVSINEVTRHMEG